MSMADLLKKYKEYFRNEDFLVRLISGLFFLAIGIIVTFFAIIYATESSSGPVTDIILSNIRVFDVDAIFVYGPVIFWVLVGIYLLSKPEKLPFTLKSIGLFLLIRSIFLNLTHIGPFPTHIHIASSGGILGVFTSGNDLFFSSHTGLPFLIALIFWDNKKVRNFCLAGSLFFGTIVLLGHLHYSIDVFAAFFITYSIFHIALKAFKEDYKIFKNGIN